jgi:hypothetical protein
MELHSERTICSRYLRNWYYASQLQTWFTSSENPPSLLLYGCHVAAGDAGEEFIGQLAQLTGANIAASAQKVGNGAKGGSWQLEKRTFEMEAGLAFAPEVVETYAGVFAVSFSNASNFEAGSGARSVAVGDFNGDGISDLAIAYNDSISVRVLLGQGNGSFGPFIDSTVGEPVVSTDDFSLGLYPSSVTLRKILQFLNSVTVAWQANAQVFLNSNSTR